ncbi:hypothetical protein AB0G02_39625, partial [Actinosynnema sp. NPDC023658]|uniref:hypothetical protein n=1 Tax=Actinosynnema sp. NPDC023658 TaxID=3155465 RepID=UPI0033DEC3FD
VVPAAAAPAAAPVTAPAAASAGPPVAASGANAPAGRVHARPVPRVPLLIDGVRLAPEQISRFDGKPLYLFADQRTPDLLVGYTDESRAKSEVARREAAVTPLSAGQSVVVYSGDEGHDDSQAIQSGWSVNNLVAVARGCGVFGCAGNWNDVISSALMNGNANFYADPNFGGGWLNAWGGNWRFNMSTYGFDNIVSSVNVWW